MTPEQKKAARKAEVWAELDDIFGKRRPPKPKTVVADAVVVRDADVRVSRADPNAAAKGEDRVVEVRRADWVTINMELYERQQAERAAARAQRRAIDPCGLGLYGPVEEEE